MIVAMTAERVAALRIEIFKLVSPSKRVVCLGRTCPGHRAKSTVAVVGGTQIHLTLHVIHIFLSVFNHLDSFYPLLFEVGLGLFNLSLLDLNPPIDLLVLGLESARRHLVLLEQLLYVFSLFLLFEFEDFFTELDQFRVLAVLHDHV